MSLLLQGGEQINNLQVVLSQIRRLMVVQFQAELLSLQNRLVYYTKMMISDKKLDLYWRFQPFKSTFIKVCVRPDLFTSHGPNFKVQTQRSITDLLKIIHKCNIDKNKVMSFFINEHNSIEMCANFQLTQNLNEVHLRKLIQNTHSKLPEVISKLLIKLQPFLQLGGTVNQQKNLSQTALRFIDYSYRFVVLSKYNQIRNEKDKDEPEHAISQQIQKEIQLNRTHAYRVIKDPFALLVNKQSFLKYKKEANISAYSQWLKRSHLHKNKDLPKNVLAIKVLDVTDKPLEKQSIGSHCKISLSEYKVQIMLSINPGLQNAQIKQAPLLAGGVQELEQKKIQIVKKVVKNIDKLQSRNSFENQLDFILYIKQKSCKYVSTYYWVYQKKKEEMQAILMKFYPQSLREVLQSQKRILSFGSKLDLSYRITKSISWIASQYVCHRDIKPQNIMIDQHRNPKLIDFGSCCPANGLGTLYFKVKESRLLGTPNYYCPYDYQNTNHPYKRNQYEQHILFDVYSLGKVMRDIFEDCLPNLLPNLQGFMKYIIERCEEKDPIRRLTYQQIQYFLHEVIRYLDWLEKDN